MTAPASSPPSTGAGTGLLGAVGEAAALLARSLWELGVARPGVREVLRQAALVATASVVVLAVVGLLAGAGCGTESIALTRQLGARTVQGGLSALCGLREVLPFVFGYVLAVTVGCELVADLAAGDPADDPARRAAPRVVGALLVAPFAYLLTSASVATGYLLVGMARFSDVSPGAFIGVSLGFQDITDFLYAATKGLLMATFVLATALLLGSRARSDPEAAGRAMARFALVAVVGVTLLGALGTLVFWGGNARIEVG